VGGSDELPPSADDAGAAGLIYAAFGAYVHLLLLLISRINSEAVTDRFLANSTIRVAMAMVLGFVAGRAQLFSDTPGTSTLTVYFLSGLFLSWAMDALRERAKKIFGHQELGCDMLPLCLVDGLDDGIIDRLAEVGAWDVQHVACANPIALTRKTLYPFGRVLDWVNQAILIGEVRDKIVEFRAAGIRDSVSLAVLYSDASGLFQRAAEAGAQRKDRADALFKYLAQRTSYSVEMLMAIGRNLYDDYRVNFIWDCGIYEEQPCLEQLIRAAVLEAAANVKPEKITFKPDPKPGRRVCPPLPAAAAVPDQNGFEKLFVDAIKTKLDSLGYDWTGTYADVQALTEWSAVFGTILSRISSLPR
jgi:hypothetical protein